MFKKLMLVFLISCFSLVCLSQNQFLGSFKRDLSIDPVLHSVTALQENSMTKESYFISLKTFPYDDGDSGVEYDKQGNLTKWLPFKIFFSVTKLDGNPEDNCYISLEKTIRVILDFNSNQLKIDNIPDLNDLINFSQGTSVEDEVSAFLTTLKHYFPFKVTPDTLSEALGGITNFFQDRYRTLIADPTGGAVAVAIIAVVCIWECPIIVGCAIGAGGFNIYWAQCVGVAPST
ncbi:MAG: hypothetical protein GYA35_04655 [Thermoanaerobaculaceae bacterium]|nr:hypothetical protein [Thermoanaerobaculaceae bacterium]